jgi:hypothetical protein
MVISSSCVVSLQFLAYLQRGIKCFSKREAALLRSAHINLANTSSAHCGAANINKYIIVFDFIKKTFLFVAVVSFLWYHLVVLKHCY